MESRYLILLISLLLVVTCLCLFFFYFCFNSSIFMLGFNFLFPIHLVNIRIRCRCPGYAVILRYLNVTYVKYLGNSTKLCKDFSMRLERLVDYVESLSNITVHVSYIDLVFRVNIFGNYVTVGQFIVRNITASASRVLESVCVHIDEIINKTLGKTLRKVDYNLYFKSLGNCTYDCRSYILINSSGVNRIRECRGSPSKSNVSSFSKLVGIFVSNLFGGVNTCGRYFLIRIQDTYFICRCIKISFPFVYNSLSFLDKDCICIPYRSYYPIYMISLWCINRCRAITIAVSKVSSISSRFYHSCRMLSYLARKCTCLSWYGNR